MTLDTWLPASGLTMEQFIADLHRQANDVARESLALDALARELKVEVTEDDINAEFEKAGVKDVEACRVHRRWPHARRPRLHPSLQGR